MPLAVMNYFAANLLSFSIYRNNCIHNKAPRDYTDLIIDSINFIRDNIKSATAGGFYDPE